jgi:signal transduction histidine kinase
MTPRAARLLAGSLLAMSVAMLAASIPISAAARARSEPGRIVVVGDPRAAGMQEVRRELDQRVARGDKLDTRANPAAMVAFATFSILWLATGTLIVARQPRNFAGWIFLTIGAAAPLTVFCSSLVLYGVEARPGSVPGVGAAAVVGEYTFAAVALIPLLFLWYPDGKPPSPRWRWASRALLFGVGIALVGFVLQPGPLNNFVDDGILYENPIGIRAFAAAGAAIAIGNALGILALISTIVAVILRFRRSRGEERQQMRLLAFVAGTAGALLVVFIAAMLLDGLLASEGEPGEGPIWDILFSLPIIVLAFGVPGAYLTAIFRYRLFDIDVVIKKTVILALLGLVATVVYGGLVLLVGSATVWTSAPPLVFLIGVLAGMAYPVVRGRARRLADRIVYGRRATPYEVLTEFSDRIAETYSADDVMPRMVRLLASATGAEFAAVWLCVGPQVYPVASWPLENHGLRPLPLDGDRLPAFPQLGEAFEVRQGAELLGALTARMPASDPMNPAKAKLIANLASQAGLLLRNVRLIEELRESRRRIVTAQDERAKALERNVHDGAQQQLVALAVKLGLAKSFISKNLEKTEELLGQLQQDATDALENLRELARGIYPPLLADKGLGEAVRSQARRASVPVEVEVHEIGRYPQEKEAAVYFCILEALQNVAKYANASNVIVKLFADNDRLSFSVTDDGHGFDADATNYGTGLLGMADRLEALGGTLSIQSSPGQGTTVMGSLPSISRPSEHELEPVG